MPLLTCLRCGSALTTLATATTPMRCPVCGAALSSADQAPDALPIREASVREESQGEGREEGREEDISATRAVARERMAPLIAEAQIEAQTDRPGAPHTATAQTADEATHALPASAIPLAMLPADAPDPREATHALPRSALPSQERRTMARAQRTLSVALVALTLVAVVVMAALAANGVISFGAAPAEPTATTTPAVTATPGVVAFTLPGLYQISYPRGWLIQQRNSPPQTYYALLTAPAGGSSVNIEAQRAAGAPALATLDGQFIHALAQPGTAPTLTEEPTSVTVGGRAWTQIAADLTLRPANGQAATYAHVVALSTQRGAYVYTIVTLATSPTAAAAGPAFITANQAYFQPMLASFTFLS
jgi:hypothetical protein